MSNLDARVAALMSKIVNYRYVPIELVDEKREEIAQAIRAELQKPALHEPVPADVQESLKWLDRLCTEGMYRDRLDALRNYIKANGLLQGRAKPALQANAATVPTGWKLMPIEPTEKIIAAMATAWQEANDGNECMAEYHAAIAAAPPVPARAQEEITDNELLRACINASDSLNITRVHEIGGKTRTIMEDTGLLEIARAAIRASKGEKT